MDIEEICKELGLNVSINNSFTRIFSVEFGISKSFKHNETVRYDVHNYLNGVKDGIKLCTSTCAR